jgi:hypothetical protein
MKFQCVHCKKVDVPLWGQMWRKRTFIPLLTTFVVVSVELLLGGGSKNDFLRDQRSIDEVA